MPIYEYECRACGHDFEFLQKITDPVLVSCPKCAQPKLKKLISPVSFRLKGTGWYETDFKNNQKSDEVSAQPSENGGKSDETQKLDSANLSKSSSSTSDDSTKQSTESNKPADKTKTSDAS